MFMVMRNMSHSATMWLIDVFLDDNGGLWHRGISYNISGFGYTGVNYQQGRFNGKYTIEYHQPYTLKKNRLTTCVL